MLYTKPTKKSIEQIQEVAKVLNIHQEVTDYITSCLNIDLTPDKYDKQTTPCMICIVKVMCSMTCEEYKKYIDICHYDISKNHVETVYRDQNIRNLYKFVVLMHQLNRTNPIFRKLAYIHTKAISYFPSYAAIHKKLNDDPNVNKQLKQMENRWNRYKEEIIMKINKIEKTIIEIEYQEIDRIINEYYKPTPKFQFLADYESPNDSSHRIRVDGKLDEYDKEQLEEFKKDSRGQLFMTQILLNDLYSKGEIPEGNYLILVCW